MTLTPCPPTGNLFKSLQRPEQGGEVEKSFAGRLTVHEILFIPEEQDEPDFVCPPSGSWKQYYEQDLCTNQRAKPAARGTCLSSITPPVPHPGVSQSPSCTAL